MHELGHLLCTRGFRDISHPERLYLQYQFMKKNSVDVLGTNIKVINHLIDKAIRLDIKRVSIETGAGKFFAPARKLFKKRDFKPCEPFAHYKKDINSIYLTKLINND